MIFLDDILATVTEQSRSSVVTHVFCLRCSGRQSLSASMEKTSSGDTAAAAAAAAAAAQDDSVTASTAADAAG